VRNRVAHDGVQLKRAVAARTAVLTLLPVMLGVITAGTASADTGLAGNEFSFGAVGIVAVVIGVGGLVLGLFRRRRIAARPVEVKPQPAPEPSPSRVP
jgi:hypothetical protein